MIREHPGFKRVLMPTVLGGAALRCMTLLHTLLLYHMILELWCGYLNRWIHIHWRRDECMLSTSTFENALVPRKLTVHTWSGPAVSCLPCLPSFGEFVSMRNPGWKPKYLLHDTCAGVVDSRSVQMTSDLALVLGYVQWRVFTIHTTPRFLSYDAWLRLWSQSDQTS